MVETGTGSEQGEDVKPVQLRLLSGHDKRRCRLLRTRLLIHHGTF